MLISDNFGALDAEMAAGYIDEGLHVFALFALGIPRCPMAPEYKNCMYIFCTFVAIGGAHCPHTKMVPGAVSNNPSDGSRMFL